MSSHFVIPAVDRRLNRAGDVTVSMVDVAGYKYVNNWWTVLSALPALLLAAVRNAARRLVDEACGARLRIAS
jgi:hypothetical protein